MVNRTAPWLTCCRCSKKIERMLWGKHVQKGSRHLRTSSESELCDFLFFLFLTLSCWGHYYVECQAAFPKDWVTTLGHCIPISLLKSWDPTSSLGRDSWGLKQSQSPPFSPTAPATKSPEPRLVASGQTQRWAIFSSVQFSGNFVQDDGGEAGDQA